ncbi:MAG: hypothetical protein HY912_20045 [Desulfomonile tiedjei]|uniref:Uncharacterized protein n=1 Tax=Desulfomonile tiedjei TaxID=2358 RepID=A0A9D6Z871_9BACT|nr:hypothetical protein [Desulfomonile tiedjei]
MAKASQAVKDQGATGVITEREALAWGDFNEMYDSAVVLSLTERGFLYESDGQIVCTELGAEIQKLALKEIEEE